jgi:hypothetical protein
MEPEARVAEAAKPEAVDDAAVSARSKLID